MLYAKIASYVVTSNLILYILLRNAVRAFWMYSGQFTWAAEILLVVVACFFISFHFIHFAVLFRRLLLVRAALWHTQSIGASEHHPSVVSSDSISRVYVCLFDFMPLNSNCSRTVLHVCARTAYVVWSLLSFSTLHNINAEDPNHSLLHKYIHKAILFLILWINVSETPREREWWYSAHSQEK